MQPLQLPYYRDAQLLPGPLPTKQQIESSKFVLAESSAHKVVLVGKFAIKYGVSERLQTEGENLLFVERNLSIRAPRLYAMYRDSDGTDDNVYVIMEFIPGQPLHTLWASLAQEDKTQIMSKIQSMLDQMRALPSPGFYGSVSKGSLPHTLFWSADNDPLTTGPFNTEHDFNMALARRSRENWAYNGKHGYISDFFESNLSRALQNHPSTFTHADLQRKNIIIRRLHTEGDTGGNEFDVALVDWESSAWYPSYWEYANALLAYHWDDDWFNVLEKFITPYPAEGIVIKMVWQDLVC